MMLKVLSVEGMCRSYKMKSDQRLLFITCRYLIPFYLLLMTVTPKASNWRCASFILEKLLYICYISLFKDILRWQVFVQL